MTAAVPRLGAPVRLVMGIARLGENDLRGWWRGHALDRTGQYVLSSMFRRTWRPAALELDVAAATLMHNDLLSRPTAVHLFSDLLPFRRWALGWLAEQKTAERADPLLLEFETWTEQIATESLGVWSDGERTRGESLGDGLLLGRLTSGDLADVATRERTARLLATAYISQTGPLRPPYFDLAR